MFFLWCRNECETQCVLMLCLCSHISPSLSLSLCFCVASAKYLHNLNRNALPGTKLCAWYALFYSKCELCRRVPCTEKKYINDDTDTHTKKKSSQHYVTLKKTHRAPQEGNTANGKETEKANKKKAKFTDIFVMLKRVVVWRTPRYLENAKVF